MSTRILLDGLAYFTTHQALAFNSNLEVLSANAAGNVGLKGFLPSTRRVLQGEDTLESEAGQRKIQAPAKVLAS